VGKQKTLVLSCKKLVLWLYTDGPVNSLDKVVFGYRPKQDSPARKVGLGYSHDAVLRIAILAVSCRTVLRMTSTNHNLMCNVKLTLSLSLQMQSGGMDR